MVAPRGEREQRGLLCLGESLQRLLSGGAVDPHVGGAGEPLLGLAVEVQVADEVGVRSRNGTNRTLSLSMSVDYELSGARLYGRRGSWWFLDVRLVSFAELATGQGEALQLPGGDTV